MTILGWVQIALYALVIILITKPFGGYMDARVQRRADGAVLAAAARRAALYRLSGVDENRSRAGSPMPLPCCCSALPAS